MVTCLHDGGRGVGWRAVRDLLAIPQIGQCHKSDAKGMGNKRFKIFVKQPLMGSRRGMLRMRNFARTIRDRHILISIDGLALSPVSWLCNGDKNQSILRRDISENSSKFKCVKMPTVAGDDSVVAA